MSLYHVHFFIRDRDDQVGEFVSRSWPAIEALTLSTRDYVVLDLAEPMGSIPAGARLMGVTMVKKTPVGRVGDADNPPWGGLAHTIEVHVVDYGPASEEDEA
ncbi:hypothetical protein HOU03_gp068 [Caulobacter phage CcrSC]|uniref:Uncharacterized protein n=1 Tax=Caulobacter phage CcrSC TaxID=2283272 RepID=A0A385EDA8_9CAUD|nr:hypothetical protein HOU03_gp068 [Caulobacter phage CcrSC]AXQ69650.1 hypothetical protein CcrSC_gp068c [Caulobacter phage CcrSC]